MAGKAGKKAGAPEATQVAEPEVEVLTAVTEAKYTFETEGAYARWEAARAHTGFEIGDFEATELEVVNITIKKDRMYVHLAPTKRPVFMMGAESLKALLPEGRVDGDEKEITFDLSGLIFFSDGGKLAVREA